MYKVLIVEDDPMVAMINEQYVTRNKDFTVAHKCSDGKSALEYLDGKQLVENPKQRSELQQKHIKSSKQTHD